MVVVRDEAVNGLEKKWDCFRESVCTGFEKLARRCFGVDPRWLVLAGVRRRDRRGRIRGNCVGWCSCSWLGYAVDASIDDTQCVTYIRLSNLR